MKIYAMIAPNTTDEEIEIDCKEANYDGFMQKIKKAYNMPIGEGVI